MTIKYNTSIMIRPRWLVIRTEWNARKCMLNHSLPFVIDKTKWDAVSKLCKKNTFHNNTPAALINREIRDYTDKVSAAFDYFAAHNIMPSIEQLKAFLRDGRGVDDITITEALDRCIEREKARWADATLKKYQTLKKHLQAFAPNKRLADVDCDFLDALIIYYIDAGFNNTTTRKAITQFTGFLRWCYRQGLYDIAPLQKFQYKMKNAADNAVVYLTWTELMNLYSFEFNTPALNQVRDAFCFCCFTSLRYSDLANLRRCNIADGCIKIVTQKTSEPLTIELNNYAAAILEKYQSLKIAHDRPLPIISNQKMNENLKTIGKILELHTPINRVHYVGNKRVEQTFEKWQLLTTHCGRRTFIVNSLYLGIPAEVVMKWTGHADYKAMKPYIAIVDELKQKEMKKWNR